MSDCFSTENSSKETDNNNINHFIIGQDLQDKDNNNDNNNSFFTMNNRCEADYNHSSSCQRHQSDDVCSNCSYPDSLEMSSSSGSCNSIKETTSKGSKRSSGQRDKLQRQRSEGGCADLNGSSKSSKDAAKRRPKSETTMSKNAGGLKAFSMSLDTGAGYNKNDKYHDSTECVKDAPVIYLTPLQRKEREGKELKKEMTKLYQDLSQKDEKIFQLTLQMEEQTKEFRDELKKKSSEIKDLHKEIERINEAKVEEKASTEEELAKMVKMYADLKLKQKTQEDQFQERFLDMYNRGHKAALFERDQELEMIASSKQPKVTVKELTRKLSRTESELAKWQNLKLDETYKSAEKPVTDADVTLSFLRDSFYHFVCDREDCLRHFRAIVEIFRYSDFQMAGIRKAVSDSKEFSKMFKNEIDFSK